MCLGMRAAEVLFHESQRKLAGPLLYYTGISLIRNDPLPGSYSSLGLGPYGGPGGGGLFHMRGSRVLLKDVDLDP